MAGTREEIYDALLALLKPLAEFKTATRRRRPLNYFTPANTPALMLVETGEKYEKKSVNLPPIRSLYVGAVIINDVGSDPNELPTTAVNNAVDAIDAALAPNFAQNGHVTLGELCDAVYVEGKPEKAPGDFTGKAVTVLPITILMP